MFTTDQMAENISAVRQTSIAAISLFTSIETADRLNDLAIAFIACLAAETFKAFTATAAITYEMVFIGDFKIIDIDAVPVFVGYLHYRGISV